MTQVLLFKFRDEHASFKANSAKVSINSGVLEHVSSSIQQKVIAYSSDYVSSIKDL